MQLIKFLGTREVPKANGQGTRKGSFGIFLCPVCGEEIEKETVNGKKGKSCGKPECMPSKSLRHGYTGTKIYNSWANMKARCNNPKNRDYERYGAKGIVVCAKWDKFEGFLEDMGESYIEGYDVDRIDSSKGYYKENCQWLSRSENGRKDNEKEVIQLDEKGNEIARYESVKKAAEVTGLNHNCICRVARGDRPQTKGTYWSYTNG